MVIIAVADAPEPPPPTIETRGEDVYPLPPAVTSIESMPPSTTTDAAASTPPPPAIVMTGGDAASYPEPVFVMSILVIAPKSFFSVDL